MFYLLQFYAKNKYIRFGKNINLNSEENVRKLCLHHQVLKMKFREKENK